MTASPTAGRSFSLIFGLSENVFGRISHLKTHKLSQPLPARNRSVFYGISKIDGILAGMLFPALSKNRSPELMTINIGWLESRR
jgi:hypothetical protein